MHKITRISFSSCARSCPATQLPFIKCSNTLTARGWPAHSEITEVVPGQQSPGSAVAEEENHLAVATTSAQRRAGELIVAHFEPERCRDSLLLVNEADQIVLDVHERLALVRFRLQSPDVSL